MPGVLLMEDEAIIARSICRLLDREGYTVTHARSAAEARIALAKREFDLVLADVNLGDGDGIELLSGHQTDLAGVPIVVMTGQDSIGNRARAEGISVAAFLPKPFALSRMRELVGTLIAETGNVAGQQRGPSVMMYSHDTIGLGHMSRNMAIARELVARVPGASVLMLVGCPAGMMFEPQPGIDYVKLPSLMKLGRGRWQACSLRIDAATTRALRAGIIAQAVRAYRPDIVLVDHEPAGVWEELVAPLRELKEEGRARVVLGLRDILDDPDRVAKTWEANGIDAVIADLYDDVLVYGNEGFYPSHSAYGLDELRPGRVRYCGAVTTAFPARLDRWAGTPRRVLASGGGGRDAFILLDTALSALESIAPRRRPELTLVAGPLMDEELRKSLSERARRIGALFFDAVPSIPQLLAVTDLHLTMGGYNSVTESLAAGCPFVVVPRVGPSAEQRLRAEQLRKHDLATVLWRDELTPARLAKLMTSPPPRQKSARKQLDFNGAARAAVFLADALAEVAATGTSIPPQAGIREAKLHV